jgi:glycosyltransferase involved in cell wall biosynthesis
MRILGLAQAPLGRQDGAAAHVIGLYSGFRELEVEALCLAPSYMPSGASLPFRTARVPVTWMPAPWTLLWHLLSPLWLLFHLITFRPDVLYLRGSLLVLPVLLARLAGAPAVVEVNSEKSGELLWQSGWRRRMTRLEAICSRITYRMAARLLTVTPQLSTLIIDEYGADPARCRVVSNGFDPDVYQPQAPADAQRALGLDMGRRYIVFVARLTKRHSLELMIDGFARLAQSIPDVDLIIVGDGPARPDVESLCRERGVEARVRFAGQVPGEVVAQYISASRFGIAQLQADRNAHRVGASPIKVWSYLGCARPVLAGSVPTLRDVLQDGNCGIVLEDASAETFADAAGWFLTHEEDAAQMGQNGYELARREYTWRAVAEKTIFFLREVVDGS